MSAYKAEYIWIDGAEPTPKLRSKTKIVEAGKEPPIWGFVARAPLTLGPDAPPVWPMWRAPRARGRRVG